MPKATKVIHDMVVTYQLKEGYREILEKLGRGLSKENLAKEMGVHLNTVERRLVVLRKRFNVHKTRDLAEVGRWMVSACRPEPPKTLDCETCGREGLIGTKFVAWPVDERCDDCARNSISQKDQERHKKAIYEGLQKVLRDSKSLVALPNINQFLGGLFEAHGGLDNFIGAYMEHLKLAGEKNPGANYVLNQYKEVARMLMRADEENADHYADMSREEIVQYLKNQILTDIAAEGQEGLLDTLLQEDGEYHDEVKDQTGEMAGRQFLDSLEDEEEDGEARFAG